MELPCSPWTSKEAEAVRPLGESIKPRAQRAPRQFHAGHDKGWGRSGQREAQPCCILPTMPAPLGSHAPISFDDALRQAQAGGGMHLLLGNGFSMGAHAKFAYSSLYDEAANTNSLSPSAMAIFDQYKTRNFEGVLQRLRDAEWLSELYGIHEGMDSLRQDHSQIKNALISAIESVHPNQSDLPENALESADYFLRRYDTIFSICYDLLLYWTMNIRAPEEYRFQDGFSGQDPPKFTEREDEGRIFVCFLHGALHLLPPSGICKIPIYAGILVHVWHFPF